MLYSPWLKHLKDIGFTVIIVSTVLTLGLHILSYQETISGNSRMKQQLIMSINKHTDERVADAWMIRAKKYQAIMEMQSQLLFIIIQNDKSLQRHFEKIDMLMMAIQSLNAGNIKNE